MIGDHNRLKPGEMLRVEEVDETVVVPLKRYEGLVLAEKELEEVKEEFANCRRRYDSLARVVERRVTINRTESVSQREQWVTATVKIPQESFMRDERMEILKQVGATLSEAVLMSFAEAINAEATYRSEPYYERRPYKVPEEVTE